MDSTLGRPLFQRPSVRISRVNGQLKVPGGQVKAPTFRVDQVLLEVAPPFVLASRIR